MTALLLQFGPYLAAAGVALLAILKAYTSGKKAERAKTDKAKLEAAHDRLEMDREATAVERKAAGMTDDEARAEAMKWAKR